MEVERKDTADVLPQGTEQGEFAELKLRACQIQRSARLNRKQKKLTNLLIFTFASIALRVEDYGHVINGIIRPSWQARFGIDR